MAKRNEDSTQKLDGASSGTLKASTARQSTDTGDTRRLRIAEAAYYRAERRGFVPGGEDGDWLDAEKEIVNTTGGARADSP